MEQTQKKKQNKKILIFGAVFILALFVVCLGATLSAPKEKVLFEYNFPVEPDKFYYEEINIQDGTLKIDLSCNDENVNLLWYIMKCNGDTWSQSTNDDFYDLTYKSGLAGGSIVSDTVTIEEGTYTLIWIQTSQTAGEQTVAARVVYSPA